MSFKKWSRFFKLIKNRNKVIIIILSINVVILNKFTRSFNKNINEYFKNNLINIKLTRL